MSGRRRRWRRGARHHGREPVGRHGGGRERFRGLEILAGDQRVDGSAAVAVEPGHLLLRDEAVGGAGGVAEEIAHHVVVFVARNSPQRRASQLAGLAQRRIGDDVDAGRRRKIAPRRRARHLGTAAVAAREHAQQRNERQGSRCSCSWHWQAPRVSNDSTTLPSPVHGDGSGARRRSSAMVRSAAQAGCRVGSLFRSSEKKGGVGGRKRPFSFDGQNLGSEE